MSIWTGNSFLFIFFAECRWLISYAHKIVYHLDRIIMTLSFYHRVSLGSQKHLVRVTEAVGETVPKSGAVFFLAFPGFPSRRQERIDMG